MKYDVCIVGGGLSGILTAALLSERGFKIAVVENGSFDDKISGSDPRTIAISHGNVDVFDQLGIRNEIIRDSGIIKTIEIWDRSEMNITYNARDVNIDGMGYVVYNTTLYKSLLKILNKNGTKLIDNAVHTVINKVDQGPFEIHIAKDNIFSAKLLIISDGTNSATADKFGFKKYSWNYNQIASVFEIDHESAHCNTAVEKFESYGPIACLPLHNQYRSAVVWTQTKEMNHTLKDLNSDELSNVLQYHIPRWYNMKEISTKPSYFPFHLTIRTPATKNNIALVGNCLHTIHPIAGQGFNVIMRDIKLLCQNIRDECLIDSKYNCIYYDAGSMAAATHLINYGFMIDIVGSSFIRKIGMKMLDNIDSIKSRMIKHASGI